MRPSPLRRPTPFRRPPRPSLWKPRRQPWERAMTLCIAATCINNLTRRRRNDVPSIVICADMLVSASGYSSETEFKRVEIGPYVALFSGTTSEARELLSSYSDFLAANPLEGDPLSAANRLAQLRQPLENYKWHKLDHLVRMRLGMGYTEFLERGDQIDSQVRTPILADLWALTVEVELLLASIVPGPDAYERSFIFRLTNQDLEVRKNFAAIGEGTAAAEQSLHRREQSELSLLTDTLYHVYEAKRMAELAPSIGKHTSLAVIEPDDEGEVSWKIRAISHEAKEYLESRFLELGPKSFSYGDIKFPVDPYDLLPISSPVPPPAAPPDSRAS